MADQRTSSMQKLSSVSSEKTRNLDSLEQALHASRRVCGALREMLSATCPSVDWTHLGNIRVTDEKIVLFVKNALQKTKLRQILPRLEAATQSSGFIQAIEIVVRPTSQTLTPKEVFSSEKPREGDAEGASYMEKKAETLIDGNVKEALLSLAKTLRD